MTTVHKNRRLEEAVKDPLFIHWIIGSLQRSDRDLMDSLVNGFLRIYSNEQSHTHNPECCCPSCPS